MQGSARSAFEYALLNTNRVNQLHIAEQLNVSKRTLQAYLYGEKYPPCEVIANAVDLYGIHGFALEHLSKNCPVARLYMGEMQASSLAGSILRMQKEISDIQELNKKIIAIACDERIDIYERSTWEQAELEIQQAISAMIAVVAAGKEFDVCNM